MKKIILILSLCLPGLAYSTPQNNQPHKKVKLSQDHKKQLIEQNKQYEEEKRNKGSNTDSNIVSDGEVVDFSTGKPVKK